MARIRSNILYKWKVKEIEVAQKQAQRLHIALPVLNNQENDDLESDDNDDDDDENLNVSDLEDEENLNVSDLEDDEENLNVSDLENNTNDNLEKESEGDFHWSETCTNWINLVDRENQFDNEDDDHLLEMSYNFHAAGRNIHPADDETAKWKLEYLFKENFKAPTFLEIEINSYNTTEM